jgi:hypothetical protein
MVLLVLVSSSANATLVSRSGGQAYYDTDTDLTWVADANLAQTSGYDADGQMSWSAAVAWAASLNAGSGYLGVSDWRLPTSTDTGAVGCDFAYSGTDCGFNVDLSTSEMAQMFYGTLGNTAAYNISGVRQPCESAVPNRCLTNTGPFSNLQPDYYWSGTVYHPTLNYAWTFGFNFGFQGGTSRGTILHAWAVRPGDIALVPVPATVWLFGSALGLMGWMRRKISS